MNEQSDFERLVADQLATAGVGTPPESAIEDTIARAGGSRRLPEWLALLKEPPMRTNSHLAVGSPTVRVLAVMAAALLLIAAMTVAGAGAQRLLAADGVIVVARDGSGDYTTIAEAVTAAEDGDKILVRPGTYVEAVVVDKDVTMQGDGPAERIVITAPESGPVYETGFSSNPEATYALVLVGSGSELSGLTFRGQNARLFIDGGAPMVERVSFDGVGQSYTGGGASVQAVVIMGGSSATVTQSAFRAGGGVNVFEHSNPLISDNDLDSGPGIFGDFGDGTVIRNNDLFGEGNQGIDFRGPSGAKVIDNRISDRGTAIIAKGAALVEGNVVRGAGFTGIRVPRTVSDGGETVIRANELTDSRTAILWDGHGGAIEGNTVVGGTGGILVANGSPEVRGNAVEGVETQGIYVGPGTSPTLSGNTSCGNGENLSVGGDATPQDDGTNEICEGAPAE